MVLYLFPHQKVLFFEALDCDVKDTSFRVKVIHWSGCDSIKDRDG